MFILYSIVILAQIGLIICATAFFLNSRRWWSEVERLIQNDSTGELPKPNQDEVSKFLDIAENRAAHPELVSAYNKFKSSLFAFMICGTLPVSMWVVLLFLKHLD